MTTATGLIYATATPLPQNPGDIVGFTLQNTTSAAQAAGPVTLSQTFLAGAVAPGANLWATIGGVAVPVQMDAKTFNADGSVAMAVLTVQAPALAAGAQIGAMLSTGGAPPAAPVVSMADLTAPGAWNFNVNLTVHDPSGTNTAYQVNGASALAQALADGSASTWRSGTQVTQTRVDVPITSSLHVTLDISRFANGTISTDVQFNNDDAMQAVGGTLNYDVSIQQNGTTAFSQSNLTQFQYQTWHTTVNSSPVTTLNVVHDTSYLEQTGAILNYDLTPGVNGSLIAGNTAQMSGSGFGILGNAGVVQYMGTTGGRNDIGPATQANTIWLLTGNADAASYALAQADAAGSVPWHFYDPTTHNYTNTDTYPDLWVDGRGGSSGTIGLTQPADDFYDSTRPGNGWQVDTAHQPDLTYDAYLLTGNRYYLDQLNAQANNAVLMSWGAVRNTDVILNNQEQVRAQAWNLREIAQAAYANPAGSAEKTYFTKVLSDNLSSLIAMMPTLTVQQGQAYGWIPGVYGNSATNGLAPWQQDYFASTIITLAEQGNAQAKTILQWEQNFLVGRFLNSGAGFNPNDGAAYNLIVGTNGTLLNSWNAIEGATQAAGDSNGSGWNQSQGDYARLALESLAGSITVLQSPDAVKAYGWLIANGPAGQVGGTANAADPTFDVAPRLSDGQLLGSTSIYVTNDATAAVIQGGNTDQLIAETGAGDVVLQGGTGIDVLFGGAGSDWLIGGAGADSLYGGSGSDTLCGGSGTNWLDGGTGPDAFVLLMTDGAVDTIADFKPGVDHLDVLAAPGVPASSDAVAQILAGATVDAAGDAVLHLSATHTVTLLGVAPAQLTTAMFSAAAPVVPTDPVIQTASLTAWGTPTVDGGSATGGDPGGSTGGTSGGGDDSKTQTNVSGTVSLTQSYYAITGGSQALTLTDLAGRNTISGGSGGLTFNTTVGADLITTAVGSTNTITLAGPSTVHSNGKDTINGGNSNSIFVATGAAVINGSLGNSTYELAGRDRLTSVGTDVVKVDPKAAALISVAGLVYLTETNASVAITENGVLLATIVGGSVNAQIDAVHHTLSITTAAGSAAKITLGPCNATVTSLGNDTISAGTGRTTVNASGMLNLAASGGAVQLNALAGKDTVSGGNGAFTFAGDGQLNLNAGLGASNITTGKGGGVIQAGGGNVTLVGGAGADQFFSGSGRANVTLGARGDLVALKGTGAVSVTGGLGAPSTYEFLSSAHPRSEQITHFRPGIDHLVYQGYGATPAPAQTIAAHMLNLALTDGTKITFTDISHAI